MKHYSQSDYEIIIYIYKRTWNLKTQSNESTLKYYSCADLHYARYGLNIHYMIIGFMQHFKYLFLFYFSSLWGKVQLELLLEDSFKRQTIILLSLALKMQISHLPLPVCKKPSLYPHFCTAWITWNTLLIRLDTG